MSDFVFVLVHSPLVGPLTWTLVATELRDRGYRTVAPIITSALGAGPPHWQRHAQEVARDLGGDSFDNLVLVAHSGAGPILPVIRQAIESPVAAYVFADAALPENGKSRFDLFDDDEAVADLRNRARNGLLPAWNEWFPESVVEELIPADLRMPFLAELGPTPLMVYEEQIPVFAGWPDAHCGYLQFSSAYDRDAAAGRARGWPVRDLRGGHFHMLVEPESVADALLQLAAPAK